MANYTYRIISKDGKEKKGSLEAESRERALATIKTDGATVLELKEGSALNKEITFGGSKVKSRDFSVFCRQFYSLLQAGVGIVPALDMLSDQTENKTLKKAIINVHDNVQKGETLAGAMKREKKVFPPLLISMMEAGEASGNVETSLERMSEHFEKDTRIKGLLKKTMIYPIVLIIVAIVVLVVMVVAVLPKFASMFDEMEADLPGLTKGLLALSDFLINYWYIAILIIVSIVVLIKVFLKTPTGQRFFATVGLKLPVFGKLSMKTACSRFARTFSTMMSSGMPMVEAMTITAKTIGNVLYEDALNETTTQIQRGVSLSKPLAKSGLFPPLVLHMVGIGEETGNLEEMLNNCAKYYDEEVEIATQQVMALLEPMIIIVMAGIVCLILGAIYGPILTMYNTLGGV